MKTVFAVFKNSEVLQKSERRTELIPIRDQNPGSYIGYWLGHPDVKLLSDDPVETITESIDEKTEVINSFEGYKQMIDKPVYESEKIKVYNLDEWEDKLK